MTIADRKAREKERRRTDILNAAEKHFFSKGYDNVSFEDIAREVELNRATIYLYFKSKEALYLSIALRAVWQLHSVTSERLANCSDSYHKIDALGYSYLYFVRVYPDYFKIYRDFLTGRFDDVCAADAPEDWAEFTGVQKEYYNLWFDVLVTGKQVGVLKPGVDPLYAAVMLMSAIEAIADMRPALRGVLESRGINSHAFVWADFRLFIYDLIGSADKGLDSK